MIIYGAGRRMGKSTAIVSWLLEDPEHRIILVHQQQRKLHLISMIGKMINYSVPRKFWEARVVVSNDWAHLSRRMHERHNAIAIDDAEEVLRTLLGSPVELMTCTATVIKVPTPGEQKDYIDVDFTEDGWAKQEITPRRQITFEDGASSDQRRTPRSIGN